MRFLLGLALIVLAAGLIALLRETLRWRRRGPGLDDDLIRQIEEEGWVNVEDEDEDPLDWEEIRREEDRFWDEERWDRIDD